MQPQVSGAPGSTISTGPAFWSYSYDSSSLSKSAEAALTATSSSVVMEPVDAEQLNRLVAASMYSSIKQSLPYILHTQYNWTPESGPWYPQKEQSCVDTPAAEPMAAPSVRFEDSAATRRQRPSKRGCC